jgi:hypothetical protein
MTSSNEPPGGPAGQQGRRRPPTIDLKATEVGQGADPGATASSSATGAENTGFRAARDWWPPKFPWLRFSPMPFRFPWTLAAAGAGGAAFILIALALTGVFSSRDGGNAIADRRVARLEQQLRELVARPIPSTTAPKGLDDLASRLTRLETVIAKPPAPVSDAALANRLATLGGEIKALAERIDVLGRRNDEIASTASEASKRVDALSASIAEWRKAQTSVAPTVARDEIDALTGRIAALERAAKAMETQLAARVASDDRTLRMVVVANMLNAAVERGAPFAAELAAAKAVAPEAGELAALAPFATSGIPSATALARELAALTPALAKAAGIATPARESGILDRLKANAEKLVRIRPVDEVSGDEPAAVLRRLEIRTEQGNLTGAAAEIAKLPAPAHELAKPWLAQLDARNAALDASRRFAGNALAAVAKSSPQKSSL